MRFSLKRDTSLKAQPMPALLRNTTEFSNNTTEVSQYEETDRFDYDEDDKLTVSSSFGVALRGSITSSVSDISMSAQFRSSEFLEEINAVLLKKQSKADADKIPTPPGRRASTFRRRSRRRSSKKNSKRISPVVATPPPSPLERMDKEPHLPGRRCSSNSILPTVSAHNDDGSRRRESIDSATLMSMIMARNFNPVDMDTPPSQPGRKVSVTSAAATEATTAATSERTSLDRKPLVPGRKISVTSTTSSAQGDSKLSFPGRRASTCSSALGSVNESAVYCFDSKPVIPGRKESISSRDISYGGTTRSSKRDSMAGHSYQSYQSYCSSAKNDLSSISDSFKSGKSPRFSFRSSTRNAWSSNKEQQPEGPMRTKCARSPPPTRALPKRTLRGLLKTPNGNGRNSAPMSRTVPKRSPRGLMITMLKGNRKCISKDDIADLQTPDISCITPSSAGSKKKERFSMLWKPNNLESPNLSDVETTPSSTESKRKRFSILRMAKKIETADLSCMDTTSCTTANKKKTLSTLRKTRNLETPYLSSSDSERSSKKKRFSILRKK